MTDRSFTGEKPESVCWSTQGTFSRKPVGEWAKSGPKWAVLHVMEYDPQYRDTPQREINFRNKVCGLNTIQVQRPKFVALGQVM